MTTLQRIVMGDASKNLTLSNNSGGSPVNSSGVICYSTMMISASGIWTGKSPFDYSLPLFLAQVIIVVGTTRLLVIILKPLRQPRVVSEILGGIILGPSVIGQTKNFGKTIFPAKSLLTLETVAHFGLLLFLFLVGVEMDILVIKKMGRKAITIAVAGMMVPFGIGTGTSFVFRHQISKNVHQGSFLLFLGVALSVTAFPVLARILAEIKLIYTELGRIALSSAVINDIAAWILLALSIALADTHGTVLSALWVLLCAVAFIVFCFVAVRPAMWWLVRRIPEGDGVNDFQVCLIVIGVMVAGLITDTIGVHAVFGAFVFGLVIPNGPLGEALIEKMDSIVTGLLLPLFFVNSGLRTDLLTISDPIVVGLLVLVFVLASVGKVAGTLLISVFYAMPFREGLALGFLMNTRGLVEMIILNIGRDKRVLDDQSFAVLVIMSVLMTAVVTPVVTTIHRPARRLLLGYKRRNLQRWKPDTELRMLTCVHNPRNVPTIIGLLEISNPTKRCPIFLYVLHLIELNGRASAVIAAHAAGINKTGSNLGTAAKTENIFAAFGNYEQHAGGVSISPVTSISQYATMHEDVCNLAEDKHVTMIVLPFHKHLAVDGGLEVTNPAIRNVNNNILANAPCSVGLLVDRGLGSAARTAAAMGQHFSHHVACLFFGGPDDREALAYAWRMVEHPGVGLTVVRFLPASTNPHAASTTDPADPRVVTVMTSEQRERDLDEDYFNDFRLRNASNESIVYAEVVVANSEETVAAIRAMDDLYDLYVVGRGEWEGPMAELTMGMTEFSEYPELGPIGDILVSSDFGSAVSVLVVQQYNGPTGVESPRRPQLDNAGTRTRTMGAAAAAATTPDGEMEPAVKAFHIG